MRHAEIDLVDAACGCTFDELVEHRNDRLAALKRKAFLAEILFVQELLELLGLDQFRKQLFFHLRARAARCRRNARERERGSSLFLLLLWMWRYSMPTLPQYARRRMSRIRRSVAVFSPCSPPVMNSRSRSQIGQAEILEIELRVRNARSYSADRCRRADGRERGTR